MADLGTAYVNIVPKAPGISNNIENVLNGGGAGAEKAGQSLGKKLLGGIAMLGIGSIIAGQIKDAFDAGGDLQQSFGGLETIYGNAAGQAKDFAMQAAAAGISANNYAEQAVSFGAALKAAYGGDTMAAMEAANSAILSMADNAAKMGTPLESIQAAYQGFARGQYQLLDNLKLGYGGTRSEMLRLLDDAQALTGVEYDIDNLGDVYNAISVIQTELGLTGVAAAEAETTFTGSLGALKASWTNVLAALTTGDGIETALSNLSRSFGNFSSNVLSMLRQLATQLPTLILGLVDVVIQQAPAFITGGAEIITQLTLGLVNSLPDLIASLPEIFFGIIDAFASVDWAQLGIGIINGVIKGLTSAASKLWNKIREIVRGALGAAKAEAEIGSPSRLFAREVGRWIPAGIAFGVEEHTAPLDRAMRGLVDGSLTTLDNVTPAAATTSSDADRIISALQSLSVRANVNLEGDARKLFRVIRDTNNVRTRATSYNALAAGV